MLIREKLVRAELAAARLGIREVGPNNHGPQVKKFLAEVGLPEGYAWCDAFQSYELHAAAGRRLPIESAGVAQTYAKACALGWIVSRPLRGDLVLFDFDGDGQADDHIGIVVRVLSIRTPGRWLLRTVEGNTSSGRAGSQMDGGGVYVRTRLVSRRSVRFVRVPGYVPTAHQIRYGTSTRTSSAATTHSVVLATGMPAGTRIDIREKPKPAPKKKPAAKKKPAPRRRYYTLKRNVPLKKGETVGYQPKKGYYARPKKA